MRDDPAFVEKAKGRDLGKYADYLFGQVRELLTWFGPIDTLFFDYSFPERAEKGGTNGGPSGSSGSSASSSPDHRQRRLDLLDVPGGWDYRTPEQFMPARGSWSTVSRPLGDVSDVLRLWGYHRDEASWKSARQLVVMLIETVSRAGTSCSTSARRPRLFR